MDVFEADVVFVNAILRGTGWRSSLHVLRWLHRSRLQPDLLHLERNCAGCVFAGVFHWVVSPHPPFSAEDGRFDDKLFGKIPNGDASNFLKHTKMVDPENTQPKPTFVGSLQVGFLLTQSSNQEW